MTAAPKLLAICLNPPTASGQRTRARVQMAGRALGYAQVEIANLFAYPTRNALQISEAGADEVGWRIAQHELTNTLTSADAVLLAYGVQPPRGPARAYFVAQVAWLEHMLTTSQKPVWLVGGAPRHPSRWQRHTHRVAPGRPFEDALREALAQREPNATSNDSTAHGT